MKTIYIILITDENRDSDVHSTAFKHKYAAEIEAEKLRKRYHIVGDWADSHQVDVFAIYYDDED